MRSRTVVSNKKDVLLVDRFCRTSQNVTLFVVEVRTSHLEDTGLGGMGGGKTDGAPQNSFSTKNTFSWVIADAEKLPSYF